MKKPTFAWVVFAILAACTVNNKTTKTDLQPQWDTLRPLANPDKGWYHHQLDNGIEKYPVASDSVLATFPGMDHLYLRLCWAFAEKYDGKPWVRYIDVGSIGEWGEGHTHFSTRVPPTVDEVKANINIYLKNYRKTQLVVTDDLIYWNKPENEVNELLDFVVAGGITFRDDSPLVKWYIDHNLETWSVSHPHFFEAVYKTRPTVFELEHISSVRENGYWLGKNGTDTIPGIGVSGAEIFRNAVKLIRPTYIGYHGYLELWLAENPDLTKELLNLCGYWYFPKSAEITEAGNSKLTFSIEWINKGVAPAYSAYKLKGRLVAKGGSPENRETFEIEDSGNKNWMPGETANATYTVTVKEIPKGKYQLSIQLFDEKSGRPVEIGLNPELKDADGFFKVAEIKL